MEAIRMFARPARPKCMQMAIIVMSRAPLIYIENILIREPRLSGACVYPRAFAHNAISYGCLRCLIHFELYLKGVGGGGSPVTNADATGKKG